jgi:hypothetical protein
MTRAFAHKHATVPVEALDQVAPMVSVVIHVSRVDMTFRRSFAVLALPPALSLAAAGACASSGNVAPGRSAGDPGALPSATPRSSSAPSGETNGLPDAAATGTMFVDAGAADAIATPPTWTAPLRFELVKQGAVRWLSLGRPPQAAILAEQPWAYDGKTWKELPLPERWRSTATQRESIGIYFGRDDKPRLMGARWDASATEPAARSTQIYLRFRDGTWQQDPKEIGRLGSGKPSGMYGILGNDDPEVVCKIGDACIIKRRSGWKTIAAGVELARTWLCGPTAFLIDSRGLMRVDDAGFTRITWEFEGKGKETGFWADSPLRWWVAAGSQDALYLHDEGKWSKHVSPVKTPGAMWGSSPRDVWVVGQNGAGHFDGLSWSRVEGLSMPLEHVTGRPGEVWFGGLQGVWKGTKAANPVIPTPPAP